MKRPRGRLALIDADILLYAAAAAIETHVDFGDGDVIVEPGDLNDVCATLVDHIQQQAKEVDAVEIIVALSCNRKDNWRKDLLPSYKGNRSEARDPVHREAAKAFVREHFNVYERPRMEADDLLGVMLTKPGFHDWPLERRVIVSEDKDMLQLPGRTYNPRKKEETEVNKRYADYWHLMQTMMGDPTDGYKGIPGVGKVKAYKVLTEHGPEYPTSWDAMVALAESKGMTEDDLLVQARVARILRHGEYHKGKITYWEPRRG